MDSTALLTQAVGRLAAGDVPGAERCCRQVLAADRRDHQAAAILGRIATMTGRHREAVRLLSGCVARAPRRIDYHVLLAEALATQGRHEEALTRYGAALGLAPGHGPAVAGKANVLTRMGRWDDARALLDPLVESGAEDAGMALVYARIAARGDEPERAAAVASRHVDDDAGDEMRRSLWFEIGKAHERAGRFPEAFAAFAQANRIGSAPWDPAAASAEYDRIIAAFSPDLVAALPRAETASERAVLIVGMPRSGSTLIEQIIDAHPDAFGAGEILEMPRLIMSLGERIGSTLPYPECVRDLDAQDVNALSRAYLDGLGRLDRRAARVCDKYLFNYEHLGLIQALLPKARIIHSRRDPLDTCLSCFVNKFAPGTPAFTGDLVHLGLRYNDYLALMGHWRRVGVEMMEVDYERLVADQEAVSRAIIDYCGLPWDDACLRFFESGRRVITLSREQVTQPVYRRSVGRHERYGELLSPLQEVLASGRRGAAS